MKTKTVIEGKCSKGLIFAQWVFLEAVILLVWLYVSSPDLGDFRLFMQRLASGMAAGLLNGFGVEIGREGSTLFSRVPGREFYLDVADVCNGVRSLFAMMVVTAGHAYLLLNTTLQRLTLLACSIPIAILGNVFRILSVCLVAHRFGQERATGFYHDGSGYVFFLIGLFAMFCAAGVIEASASWLQKKATNTFLK